MNYKPWYAIAEFVDNAIDSYLLNSSDLASVDETFSQLRVVIKLDTTDDGQLSVWDNAAGIHANDYGRAFHTAEPPPDSAGLSQYGVGMKSAAAWFANTLKVRSSALGEAVCRTTVLDFGKIVEENLSEFETAVVPCEETEHFTEIRLSQLHRVPQTRTIGKIRTHLASIYREFIRDGLLELVFNGETLVYEELEPLAKPHFRDGGPDRVWFKELWLELDDGRVVFGSAGILATGSRTKAGFALFRNKRLILGSADDSWRPREIFGHTNTFRYQRVYGELHLDEFQVTHTKDGFQWEDIEEELLIAIRAALDAAPLPLLEQAEGYRARTPTVKLEEEAAKALDRTVDAVQDVGDEVLDHMAATAPADAVVGNLSEAMEVTSERRFELDVLGETWTVIVDLTNDEAETRWLDFSAVPHQPGTTALSCHIRLSLSHPFSQRFGGRTAEELEPLVRFAVGLGLAEAIARRSGVANAGTIRRNINDLFDDQLSEA